MLLRKVERKSVDWGKIFTIHIYNKRLVYRIYKRISTLNFSNGHFTKSYIQITNENMKTCLPSLVRREIQIKTTR